jgi:hypothetical protein
VGAEVSEGKNGSTRTLTEVSRATSNSGANVAIKNNSWLNGKEAVYAPGDSKKFMANPLTTSGQKLNRK